MISLQLLKKNFSLIEKEILLLSSNEMYAGHTEPRTTSCTVLYASLDAEVHCCDNLFIVSD